MPHMCTTCTTMNLCFYSQHDSQSPTYRSFHRGHLFEFDRADAIVVETGSSDPPSSESQSSSDRGSTLSLPPRSLSACLRSHHSRCCCGSSLNVAWRAGFEIGHKFSMPRKHPSVVRLYAITPNEQGTFAMHYLCLLPVIENKSRELRGFSCGFYT